ncbi:hypothetical protein ZWY2020_029115, partial [Hordeum vulgare]
MNKPSPAVVGVTPFTAVVRGLDGADKELERRLDGIAKHLLDSQRLGLPAATDGLTAPHGARAHHNSSSQRGRRSSRQMRRQWPRTRFTFCIALFVSFVYLHTSISGRPESVHRPALVTFEEETGEEDVYDIWAHE